MTEIGVMKLLMREDSVNAERFCIKFSETIKQIRQKKQPEGSRIGYIYSLTHLTYKTIDYIGFT